MGGEGNVPMTTDDKLREAIAALEEIATANVMDRTILPTSPPKNALAAGMRDLAAATLNRLR